VRRTDYPITHYRNRYSSKRLCTHKNLPDSAPCQSAVHNVLAPAILVGRVDILHPALLRQSPVVAAARQRCDIAEEHHRVLCLVAEPGQFLGLELTVQVVAVEIN